MPSPTPQPAQENPLTQRAQTLLDLGRPREAVAVLLQALSQSPGDTRALALLSLAHGDAGDYAEALRWADRAVAAAPEGEWGHRLRAIHLLSLNATGDALRAAEEAVRRGPQVPETLQTLARAQLRAGRVRDATATAERMRSLVPDSYFAHEVLGLVAIRRQKWREAEEHCRRALAIRPTSYYALNNLGVALSHATNPFGPSAGGHFLEAINCLHRAVQADPAEPLARSNLTQTVSRFLLVRSLWLLYFPMLLVPPQLPGWAMPIFLLAVGLWIGAVAVVGYRRWRRLPPAIRDFWRRERRERRRLWWETRAIRRAWVKRRR